MAETAGVLIRLLAAYPGAGTDFLNDTLQNCNGDETKCMAFLREQLGPPKRSNKCRKCPFTATKPLDMRRHERSCKAHPFTPTELKMYRKIFDEADGDSNGHLDKSELRGLVEKAGAMGFEASEEELGKMFEEMDNDGNGDISFDEFLSAMTPKQSHVGVHLSEVLPDMARANERAIVVRQRPSRNQVATTARRSIFNQSNPGAGATSPTNGARQKASSPTNGARQKARPPSVNTNRAKLERAKSITFEPHNHAPPLPARRNRRRSVDSNLLMPKTGDWSPVTADMDMSDLTADELTALTSNYVRQ